MIIRFDDLADADLHPGAIYEAGTKGNYGDEPIHKVLGVGNQSGIRQRGHEFTPENTYVPPRGSKRTCRACQKLRQGAS